MNPCPLVTIAIPTYNRAETYFAEALHSALRQTYSNIEIVVSDNCSTDCTRAMVAGIGDPRIRYFRHEPGIGQKNNYNFCFEQARGRYVLLLHDDDIIDDDFVAACMAAANGISDAGIIRTGIRIIDAEGKVTAQILDEAAGLPVDGFFRTFFSGKAPVYCCNTLFNNQKLREIGGFNSTHFCYPDTMAIFRLAALHRRCDIREPKASFRVHGGETAYARRIAEWCEDSLALLQLMCELAPESRDEIWKEGMRFFSRANYNRASKANLPTQRLRAIIKVMRYFEYHQLPSARLLGNILYGTRVYDALRYAKRSLRYSVAPFSR
jgi:glycosyltransferase involved in cell wall biosynthesis